MRTRTVGVASQREFVRERMKQIVKRACARPDPDEMMHPGPSEVEFTVPTPTDICDVGVPTAPSDIVVDAVQPALVKPTLVAMFDSDEEQEGRPEGQGPKCRDQVRPRHRRIPRATRASSRTK